MRSSTSWTLKARTTACFHHLQDGDPRDRWPQAAGTQALQNTGTERFSSSQTAIVVPVQEGLFHVAHGILWTFSQEVGYSRLCGVRERRR